MSAPKGWSIMGIGHARVLYPEGTDYVRIPNLAAYRVHLGWGIAEWAVQLQRRMRANYYVMTHVAGGSRVSPEMVAWSFLAKWTAVDPDERFDAAMTISMLMTPDEIITCTQL